MVLLSLIATFSSGGNAATLTFDGDICNPGGNSACVFGTDIGGSYGSIPGQIDVSYASRVGAGNAAATHSNLRFWDNFFGDLTNVAYAINDSAKVGEIALRPKAGFQVTLNSFDLAGWMLGGNSQVTIYDGAFNVLFSSGTISVTGPGHTTFSPGLTRSDGIVIQWGPDAWVVGIDNVNFSVSAVPEPSVFVMLAVGLGLVLVRLNARRVR